MTPSKAPVPPQPPVTPAPAAETEKLKFQLEDMQRRLDAQDREMRAKDETGRRLEQRFRELSAQIKDLEQRAGSFHRESAAAAAELRETQETLKVCDLARGQLSAALERQGQELSRWRDQARSLRSRADELEAQLRRREDALERVQKQYEDACRLLASASQTQADLERQKKDFELERATLLETVRRERQAAETIRRDGIEALEEARDLSRRARKKTD